MLELKAFDVSVCLEACVIEEEGGAMTCVSGQCRLCSWNAFMLQKFCSGVFITPVPVGQLILDVLRIGKPCL